MTRAFTVALTLLLTFAVVPVASASQTDDDVASDRVTNPSRAPWFDDDRSTVQRIDAGDPIGTAVEVSRARFDDAEAELVVVSRDDVFADSLSGTVFAHNGPILLTASDRLDGRVAAEIDRVLPSGGIVYLLGGTSALSSDVEQALVSAGYDVRRLSGPSRVETSIAVAEEFNAEWDQRTGQIVIARADSWADSITSSVWAAGRAPVLLTPSTQVHPAISTYIAEQWIDDFVIAGGEAAVAEHVAQSYVAVSPLEDRHKLVERVAGSTRVGTAAVFDTWYNGEYTNPIGGASHHVVINGFAEDGWVYGLPASTLTTGVLRGRNTSLLLVDTNRIDVPVAARVSPCYEVDRHVLVVGPESRVSARVAAAMADECVPDVIEPTPDAGWLCDRFVDVPDRFWPEPVGPAEWTNPYNWFDDGTGITAACDYSRMTVALGRGAAFEAWARNKTTLDRGGDPRLVDVDETVDGVHVYGWAGRPVDGGPWQTVSLFADAGTGTVAFIDMPGEWSYEREEWMSMDHGEVLEFAVEVAQMR